MKGIELVWGEKRAQSQKECVFVCVRVVVVVVFFADVYSTDPAVPSASEQILL